MNLSLMNRHLEFMLQDRVTVKVKEILKEIKIAHIGWEMDNKLWLVQLETDDLVVVGTNHGGLCVVGNKGLAQYYEDAYTRYKDIECFVNMVKETP